MRIKDFFFNEREETNKNEIPLEWWLERFRNWRLQELQQTDWTQLPDAPIDAASWAVYRQALRSLPSVEDFANTELPERP